MAANLVFGTDFWPTLCLFSLTHILSPYFNVKIMSFLAALIANKLRTHRGVGAE